DITNSCASVVSATAMIVDATSTSSSQNPPSRRGSRDASADTPAKPFGELSVEDNFAKAIHLDVLRLAFARQRDRHAGRSNVRPRVAGARVRVHRSVRPEF